MKTYEQEKNIYLDKIELDALLSDRNEYENYLTRVYMNTVRINKGDNEAEIRYRQKMIDLASKCLDSYEVKFLAIHEFINKSNNYRHYMNMYYNELQNIKTNVSSWSRGLDSHRNHLTICLKKRENLCANVNRQGRKSRV
ncbi:MAG: hypothetical protein GX857_04210 [Bacteroidales bacterium]|nr:hypothetical protein [Bacteroidales bacterium]